MGGSGNRRISIFPEFVGTHAWPVSCKFLPPPPPKGFQAGSMSRGPSGIFPKRIFATNRAASGRIWTILLGSKAGPWEHMLGPFCPPPPPQKKEEEEEEEEQKKQ